MMCTGGEGSASHADNQTLRTGTVGGSNPRQRADTNPEFTHATHRCSSMRWKEPGVDSPRFREEIPWMNYPMEKVINRWRLINSHSDVLGIMRNHTRVCSWFCSVIASDCITFNWVSGESGMSNRSQRMSERSQ